MRIGLIARADNRGIGQQTWEFYRHMQPAKTMVIDCPSAQPLPLRLDRFPDATVVKGLPTPVDYSNWLRGLDAVYAVETPYHYSLFTIAAQLGIKTVLHVNPEFCDYLQRLGLPRPSLFAAPTTWLYDRLLGPKCVLPVPVDTQRFNPQPATAATRFLHIVGRPAVHDRNGTTDLLLALESVRADITVTITCQEPGYIQSLINTGDIHLPGNVKLVVAEHDAENYWDLYRDQHVLLAPRRFGGLSLPMQEACAAGMPVVAPAISPQNDWLPADWLTPATQAGQFTARTVVDLYTVDHLQLAAKIDRVAADNDHYRDASARALGIAKQLSWDNLKPEYEKALAR